MGLGTCLLVAFCSDWGSPHDLAAFPLDAAAPADPLQVAEHLAHLAEWFSSNIFPGEEIPVGYSRRWPSDCMPDHHANSRETSSDDPTSCTQLVWLQQTSCTSSDIQTFIGLHGSA